MKCPLCGLEYGIDKRDEYNEPLPSCFHKYYHLIREIERLKKKIHEDIKHVDAMDLTIPADIIGEQRDEIERLKDFICNHFSEKHGILMTYNRIDKLLERKL